MVSGLVLDEPVDVVLGPVFAGGHLEHVGHRQQRLPGVPVRYHLNTNTFKQVKFFHIMEREIIE